MSLESTEIVNCRIRGPYCFLKKAPMRLEQTNASTKVGQIVRCGDCSWGTEGEFFILPQVSSQNRAVCVNFNCANNDRMEAIKEGYGH